MDRRSLPRKERLRTNIFWILFVVIIWYAFISDLTAVVCLLPFTSFITSLSNTMRFIIEMYSLTIFSVIVLAILCAFKGNGYIWKSFLPARRKKAEGSHALITWDEFAPELYGRSNNRMRMLMIGLLLGFITNFFCILCALLHGDIKLYFDASASQIPIFLFALISTFVQSTSEELWCRGFMYERLHERHPLWVSVFINGVFFGLLHMFNPSVSVLSIAGIVVCGFSYSILRWYTGSIWVAMGIHTGWNFTQNFLFGLPNSGLTSQLSLFHLDAANGMTNLIYDYGFGVEGALPALFIDALVGIVCLYLAYKNGRIKELTMSGRQIYEKVIAPNNAGEVHEQDNNTIS